MRTLQKAVVGLGALVVAFAVSAPASAFFEFIGNNPQYGTGLGAVPTTLTVHRTGSPNTPGSESGCVSWDGSSTVVGTCYSSIVGGDETGGNAGNTSWSLGDIGITSFSQLLVIFNLNEGGTDDLITLVDMRLMIFDANGNVVSGPSEGLAGAPIDFSPGNVTGWTGTGGSGLMFVLDAAEAAALDSFFDVTYHLGLEVLLTNAEGGSETFFLIDIATPVAEPVALALFGAGLVAFAGFRLRRSRFV